MAGRFVDFYALLDIAPDSSSDVVQAAITEQRKSWEAQRADGDATERSAADARLGDVDLAELVLLDPEQRADYDEEWREQRGNEVVATGGENANGKASVAVAPPATQKRTAKKVAKKVAKKASAKPLEKPSPASGDDSVAQARQAMQAGNTGRAIDSYHYAIMLEPQDVTLHHELGQAYVAAGNYEQALGAFETAARIAPHIGDYRAAIGDALIHLARPGDAIGVLEQVVAETPMEPRYRATLAQALHDTCVHEMTMLSDGLVCITTAEQAQLVERLTGRALTLLDPTDTSELAQDIREKHELATLATKRVWRPPFPWWLMIAFAIVVAAGFALFVKWWSAFIVLAVLGAVAYLLGIHPTWWHVAREARAANLLVWPQPHGGTFTPQPDSATSSQPPQ
ncbi:MAG: tetratricopeptide repeat protein [Streptosporangiales bacterium]|nr:tetratricopeptide repeat protein [Streptosporangiales bacterium]